VLYRFGPSRREPRWEWLSAREAYLQPHGVSVRCCCPGISQTLPTYGSLGAGVMRWVSSIIILFGAELNSEIEHQTARDSIVNGAKTLGSRGAVMADTVGKSQ
jgi:membrane protein